MEIYNLFININKLHTTKLGIVKIKNNLYLDLENIVDWCKSKIKMPNSKIMRKDKNYYVTI